MQAFNPADHPHRRRNLLNGGWVLVSPHRAKRPWQGPVERPAQRARKVYEPECYLCPGNARVNGVRNPDYRGTFVFDNDFAALTADTPRLGAEDGDAFFATRPARGTSRVICFSEDHSATLPELPMQALQGVVRVWRDQALELERDYAWVQLFENKGSMMGCSNPHPHGQVWASDFVPTEIDAEEVSQRDYFARNTSPLLLDYAERESADGSRTVVENADWIAVVPFWASWPFETLLLPKFSCKRMAELDDSREVALADALKRLTTRYDNIFECSFPYSMGWHGAPSRLGDAAHWQLHAHFYPPLLRSATVRKFMVGYEMLAEPQRDLTPEQAAERLQAVSEVHYLDGR